MIRTPGTPGVSFLSYFAMMDPMKRVVILSAFASPFRSGAEACAEEVPMALQGTFDFTIVTARLRRDLPRQDLLKGVIPVIRVGIGHPVDKWLFPFLAPFAVRKLKPDIVHAVLESFAGLALVLCVWIAPNAKRILTCQSTNTSLLVGEMHRCAHAVTVISKVLLERARKFGRDAILIPNGIYYSFIRDTVEANQRYPARILFVGRLEKMKGIDTLLAAASILKENGNHFHLRIVGSGSQRESLETISKSLGLIDVVTFVGPKRYDEVAEEYAQAAIFCGLSRSEALGNVFLEAQAAGCAVVATDVGGIPDIVKDSVTGFLIPPNDAQTAANALGVLLKDNALRESFGEAGVENTKKYDWSEIAAKYQEVYQA